MRSTRAIINLKAIQHNLSVIRQLAPQSKVMAVVKADAYGHGIAEVAQALDAEAFAVACMDEAIKLREAGIDRPLISLEGFFAESELRQALQLNIQTVIHQQQQVEAVLSLAAETGHKKQLSVWLKLDSGMNRLGFGLEQFIKSYQLLADCDLVKEVNLMSHLACADDIKNPMNQRQIKDFKQAIGDLSGERSMANSAGIIAWPESHFDWIRPGIALYGGSPMLGYCGDQHNFMPAMELRSQLFAIRQLKKGDSVGYGATWRAPQDTRIGVVAIGYGDGYPRHAREGTPVSINGKIRPLVGKVSMDMLTVDLGNEESFECGDEAILWGRNLAVEKVAEFADTIAYSLLCGVTSRVKFEWIT